MRSLGRAGGLTKPNRDSRPKERDRGPKRGVWGWGASKRAAAWHPAGPANPFGYWPETRRPAGVPAGRRERDTFCSEERKWALKDSNLRPMDYESTALTAELRARTGVPRRQPNGAKTPICILLHPSGDFKLRAQYSPVLARARKTAQSRLTDGRWSGKRMQRGAVAQLGARLHGMQKVRGSNPRSSIPQRVCFAAGPFLRYGPSACLVFSGD